LGVADSIAVLCEQLAAGSTTHVIIDVNGYFRTPSGGP